MKHNKIKQNKGKIFQEFSNPDIGQGILRVLVSP